MTKDRFEKSKFWTDYPIKGFGDGAHLRAPYRKLCICHYERHPYVSVEVYDPSLEEIEVISIKRYYIYIEKEQGVLDYAFKE